MRNLSQNRNAKYAREWARKNPERRKEQRLRYEEKHRDRLLAERRAYYHNNKSQWVNCDLKRRYKLTLPQYEVMLARQNGVCAICYRPPGKKRLAVDHDRKCCPTDITCGVCIRGLLCGPCNSALGLLREDPRILTNMTIYMTNGGA